jgi:hypothetical protein
MVEGADKTHTITMTPGEHRLLVKRGDLQFETDNFVLRKETTVTLNIELLKGKVQVVEGDRVIGAKALPAGPKPSADDGFVALFNGTDARGWFVEHREAAQWMIRDGMIVGRSDHCRNRNYFLSTARYGDFILCFEFQLGEKSHGGVALRAFADERVPTDPGKNLYDHPLLKLVNIPRNVKEETGTTHWLRDRAKNTPPRRHTEMSADVWQTMEIEVRGDSCRATLDGDLLVHVRLDPAGREGEGFLPGLARSKGMVGFQINTGTLRLRNIRIKDLSQPH